MNHIRSDLSFGTSPRPVRSLHVETPRPREMGMFSDRLLDDARDYARQRSETDGWAIVHATTRACVDGRWQDTDTVESEHYRRGQRVESL